MTNTFKGLLVSCLAITVAAAIGIGACAVVVVLRAKDAPNPAKDLHLEGTCAPAGARVRCRFTVENTGKTSYKDIAFVVEHQAASGTTLKRHTGTLYRVLGPGQTRTFEGVDGGAAVDQTAYFDAAIVGARPE